MVVGVEEKATKTLVNEFVRDHIHQQDAMRIVDKYKKHLDDLCNFKIIFRTKKDWCHELKNAMGSRNNKKIIMNSLLCIYVVKNSKLHKEDLHSAYQTSIFLLEGYLREFWTLRLKDKFI